MNGYLENCTLWEEFHLLTFSISAAWQLVLFIGILIMYLSTVLGNIIITLLICLVPQLHTPMYYFLCNLSVLDIIYVSTTLPKFLAMKVTGDTGLSFIECITQMFLFAFAFTTDTFLLTSMAYDRYVAICIPLRYSLIMSPKACTLFAAVSWLIGLLTSLKFSLLTSNLSFCNSHIINHFFCDVKTMIKLSSSDTIIVQTVMSIDCVLLASFPFLLILASYVFIISSIIKIRTSAGRAKAFSSCSSHLTIVILFYGTSLSSYMIPESEHSQEQDKMLSLLYTAVVPMLNPLVYSLRNKQVLKAMDNLLKCLKNNLLMPLLKNNNNKGQEM